MTQSKIQIIDHTNEIEAIKEKYGFRYFTDPRAIKEASELWGIECNEHGIALNILTELLLDKKGLKAEFHIASSENGVCLVSIGVSTAISGLYSSPSVFQRIGYASYQDARLAGIQELTDFFNKEADSANSCSSKSNREACKLAVIELHSQKTPQLNLF